MARIVEVGEKEVSERDAMAEAVVTMTPQACARIIAGTAKGDVIGGARIAGLQALKRTHEILPFCHAVNATGAEMTVEADQTSGRVVARCTVRATDRTGVEMEAMVGATAAALTIYDAAKAFDRSAEIGPIRLLEKHGGKSGSYRIGDPSTP